MRASIVVGCLAPVMAVAGCGNGPRWEVTATFKQEIVDPHRGDACADLAGNGKMTFRAPTDGTGAVVWVVEVDDRGRADRVADCFGPLAARVEVRRI